MLRHLFGYPPHEKEVHDIIETDDSDQLRLLSHRYFTSNAMVVHFNTGSSSHLNKMKLIDSLGLIENFPVRPEKCIGMSFRK